MKHKMIVCSVALLWLLLALAAFPLFSLFCMIWNRHTAFMATLLTAVTSHIIRFTADGLRDSGKVLALALMAWGLAGLLKNRKSLFFGSGFAVAVFPDGKDLFCW